MHMQIYTKTQIHTQMSQPETQCKHVEEKERALKVLDFHPWKLMHRAVK